MEAAAHTCPLLMRTAHAYSACPGDLILVHRRGGARPAEDDQVVAGAADRVADELPGVRAQPRGLQAGTRTVGVRAGVAGKHPLADEVLDEPQRPPGHGVAGVDQPPRAIGTGQYLIVADDAPAGPARPAARPAQRRLPPPGAQPLLSPSTAYQPPPSALDLGTRTRPLSRPRCDVVTALMRRSFLKVISRTALLLIVASMISPYDRLACLNTQRRGADPAVVRAFRIESKQPARWYTP